MNGSRLLLGFGLLATVVASIAILVTRGPACFAEEAYRVGDYGLAARLYDRLARCSGDPSLAIFNRGACRYRLEQLDAARTDFESCRDNSDRLRQGRALYDGGNCALRIACTGNASTVALLRDAIEAYQGCIDLGSDLPEWLVADARLNQELARRLLRACPDATNKPDGAAAEANAVAQRDSSKDSDSPLSPGASAKSPNGQSPRGSEPTGDRQEGEAARNETTSTPNDHNKQPDEGGGTPRSKQLAKQDKEPSSLELFKPQRHQEEKPESDRECVNGNCPNPGTGSNTGNGSRGAGDQQKEGNGSNAGNAGGQRMPNAPPSDKGKTGSAEGGEAGRTGPDGKQSTGVADGRVGPNGKPMPGDRPTPGAKPGEVGVSPGADGPPRHDDSGLATTSDGGPPNVARQRPGQQPGNAGGTGETTTLGGLAAGTPAEQKTLERLLELNGKSDPQSPGDRSNLVPLRLPDPKRLNEVEKKLQERVDRIQREREARASQGGAWRDDPAKARQRKDW